jgi:hypothetical protein
VKRLAYLGEIYDKVSVEVGEPDKTSDFFEFRGWRPIFDGFHFDWIYGNFAEADDQSEIVNMGLLKLTLLGSKV